jgi:hypothetical protein
MIEEMGAGVTSGPAAMPAPRSNQAPHFSAAVNDSIEDFLREYEEFADNCGLTEEQKVETLTRYAETSLREFWKSQEGYKALDWRSLKRALLKIYGGTAATKCHSKRKLKDFAKESAKFRMRDEDDIILYYRQFIVLSQPLLDTQRLTAGARDKIFWHGFHKKDHLELQTRLTAKHTHQPLNEYFNYLDVYEVAMAILGTEESDSDSNDSLDDSCSPKHRHSGHPRECRHDSNKRNSRIKEHCQASSPDLYHQDHDSCQSPPPETETRVIHFKDSTWEEEGREIDDLIRRMCGLSVQDEAYTTLYGRCA